MYINDDDLRRGPNAGAGASPASTGPASAASPLLAEYHAMMREFLRVQESVMLAYLGNPDAALQSAPPPRQVMAAPMVAPVAYAAPPALAPLAAPVVAAPVAAAPVAVPVAVPVAPAPVAAAPVAAPVAPPVAAPVAAAPASGGADLSAPKSADLMSTFLAIVADKTGYPEDALDPDQGMEADLGIDSIKRMEILGALQKTLPEAAGQAMRARMAEITELSTIRQIVTYLGTELGGGAPPPEPQAATAGVTAGVSGPFDLTGTEAGAADLAVLSRFIQTPFAEDAAHVPADLPTDKTGGGFRVLITEDAPPEDGGLHLPLIRALAAMGARPVLLPRAVIDRVESGGFAQWIDALDEAARPQGLIWLDSIQALPALDTMDLASFKTLTATRTKRFFQVLQVLAPQLQDGGRVLAAMQTGGLFGRTDQGDLPAGPSVGPSAGMSAGMSAGAGVLGIVKALGLEWPACSSKVVDLDQSQPAEARAAQLAAEIAFRPGRREVGYPAGIRTILRTEAAALSPPRPETGRPLPDASWVVLATGGARGITAECLRTLAPFGPRLVLVGRSALPATESPATQGLDAAALRSHYLDAARAEAARTGDKLRPAEIGARVAKHLADRDMTLSVAALTALGAKVDYRTADVADPVGFAALIDSLYAEFGRIDMVVHGAGLIEDKLLTDKSRTSFDRVFDTKVDSAFLLAKLLRPQTLKAICFFTSVAGRYGNRGQTDYAAANETLNRLAWALARRWPKTTVKAINWGPWGTTSTGAGMVTPPVRAQFLARGIGMVEAAPGRDLFFKEMFWAPRTQVESVAWEADGETMEEAVCALPPRDGDTPIDANLILLRSARRIPAPEGIREGTPEVPAEIPRGSLAWRFDMVSAPYTDHHRFDGQPVMPVAAIMQIMAEIPRALGDTRPVAALENLRLLKGLTLQDGPLDLILTLDPPTQDGKQTATIKTKTDPKRPRYKADIVFGEPQRATALPAPQTPAARWTGPDVAHIYRKWLSHGPRFQTLMRITELSPGHVHGLAHGTTPDQFVPHADQRRWDFDPGLIDGLLQMVWIWSRAIQQASTLPLGITAVRRFAGDPLAGPLKAEAYITSPMENSEIVTQLYVYDATGALCYQLEAFRGQSSGALNRLGGGWQGGAPEQEIELETAQ